MIDVKYSLILIAVMAIVSLLMRALPFIVFGKGKIPKAVQYLGNVLPGALMGMLVIYCFKSTVVTSFPFGLPELIATAVVVGLHLWKRNTLLSIGVGTVLYMILVQLVFI